MATRLSTKGQLVIPKDIRRALGLKPGARFDIRVVDDKIILEPLTASPIAALYGRYADDDFLHDLETEHRQEVEDDASTRA